MKFTIALVGMLMGVFGGLTHVSAQTVLTEELASRVLTLKDVKATPEKVSGVITNNTPHVIRDVDLMVQYHWLWENERNPGRESPGRSIMVKVDGPLQPGASVPFEYSPSFSPPARNDGRFMPEVTIAGFTTVVPQRTS